MLCCSIFACCLGLIRARGTRRFKKEILNKIQETEKQHMESFAKSKFVMEQLENSILLCKDVMQLDCGMTPEKEKVIEVEAALEQENASKIKFSEERKRELEELHGKFIELKKKVDAEDGFKLEVERFTAALQENSTLEVNKTLDAMCTKVSQQNELFNHLVTLSETVGAFRQEAHEKLIFDLSYVDVGGSIGVKRMGELDRKPFYAAAEQKYSADEAEEKAAELFSLWQDNIKDLRWHPFKTISDEEIIDEEDEKLSSLKKEFGDEAYNAVITALNEMKEYNCRHGVPVLWNFEEGRAATLSEGVNRLKELKCEKN